MYLANLPERDCLVADDHSCKSSLVAVIWVRYCIMEPIRKLCKGGRDIFSLVGLFMVGSIVGYNY